MASFGTVLQVAGTFPLLKKLLLSLVPKSAMEEQKNHMAFTRAKLERRMESGKERPDLVEGLLKKRDELVRYCFPCLVFPIIYMLLSVLQLQVADENDNQLTYSSHRVSRWRSSSPIAAS